MKDIRQGRFIFQFFHELDLLRVFEGGPWAFGNFSLILHRLKRGEFPLNVPLDFLPFWVQIHDLPAGYLTEGVGRLLANFIGTFLEYDSSNSTDVWRQYMRVHVDIRVADPLNRFKRIKQKDGSSFVVNFKYERLNVLFFLCGRLSHSENFCELMFTPVAKDIEREWGVWLKAADRRMTNLARDKWLRSDNTETNLSMDASAARVSTEPPTSATKRKSQENRSVSLPINAAIIPRDPIPQTTPRLALQDITHEICASDLMMIDESSSAIMDERKRRRSTITSDIVTNTASEILPARWIFRGCL
ncbi:uncharacterized protein At4g02000-like [Salvia miltiorrhiza]|uniref:uncharacterized protein At4g02000-like n=1 Tax=Salvia miltiorrhiza TaxID=226208 RepID=UPI0025AD4861|nr:uncharacterized protein At4g02000-like [Salvia miltiorrhiza]